MWKKQEKSVKIIVQGGVIRSQDGLLKYPTDDADCRALFLPPIAEKSKAITEMEHDSVTVIND